MEMKDIPFAVVTWSEVEPNEHPGETGLAHWRTRQLGPIRVRLVEYSPGYRADHWCDKGHVLLCLAGELCTQLADGREVVLRPGMSYEVGDGCLAHRSTTTTGATLFIVD